MRASPARRRPRRVLMAQINVVPYIDVMLVLLVIFMITAPLLTQGVQVKLPKVTAETVDTQAREPVVLTVDERGRFYISIGDKPRTAVEPETIKQRVGATLQKNPDVPVLVRGDRNVQYGRVMEAMVLLKQAGAESVGLITEPPERDGTTP